MNYRSLSDQELVDYAEARLVELAQYRIPGGDLWPEVLYRLARSCHHNMARLEEPSLEGRKGQRCGSLLPPC